MADGPVANLPPGMDAYGGYVNRSGIGITYPQVVAAFPGAIHFSITTDGAPAQCADVESGAMQDWTGYDYGYCSVSNVNHVIARFGRPRRLWTSHYSGTAHICSPACWPGLVTTADGTQWVDHGGWDESQLADNFFAPPIPPIPQEDILYAFENSIGKTVIVGNSNGHTVVVTSGTDANVVGGWSEADVTAAIKDAYPGTNVVVE